jgi:hypothetical protein
MLRSEFYLLKFGPLAFGCGPSANMGRLEGSEQGFMNTLQANYATNFAEQQAVLNHINGVLNPIVGAGPSQTGFSPSERAALNTQAVDTTAANAAAAERAVGTETAGRNDSGNNPESGVDQALKAGVASSAAGQLSNEELGITEADYATGRQNFENAVAGEEGVSGQEGSGASSTMSGANQANEEAFSEANTINEESNQEESDIAGGITGLAEGGLTFGAGAAGGGGFSGGIKALAGF